MFHISPLPEAFGFSIGIREHPVDGELSGKAELGAAQVVVLCWVQGADVVLLWDVHTYGIYGIYAPMGSMRSM